MIITLKGADFSVSNIDSMPIGTANFAGGTQSIVSSMRGMKFVAGKALAGGGGSYATTVGRAASVATVLKVNGGETVNLNQVVSGVNLTYALVVYSDTTGTLASTDGNFQARAWISNSVKLPSNAKYVLVAFKNGAGTSEFTAAQCNLLPGALTIS